MKLPSLLKSSDLHLLAIESLFAAVVYLKYIEVMIRYTKYNTMI